MDKGAWQATVNKVRHDVSNLASKIILTLGSITIFNCCCCSVAQSCPTLCNHMDRLHPSPSARVCSNSCPLIESMMPYYRIILHCSLLLLSSIFSIIRVFTSESALRIRWAKYWSFSFSISPSSEYSELISFRIDWLDLLAVQGTLKSLLQYHRLKASILPTTPPFLLSSSHILHV